MAGRDCDAVVILDVSRFFRAAASRPSPPLFCPEKYYPVAKMLRAAAQSADNAVLLHGAKTQETLRKAAGRNLRLVASRRDYGDIPPEMKVFALEESALEQVNSPFAMGHDEPEDRPLADP